MSENYPNSDPDRHFILDAADQLAQIRSKKAKMLATQLVPNPANDARKAGKDDGNKAEQDLSEEYPVEEMESIREPQKIGKPAPTPVIEDEDDMPSEDE
ncbi:MAG: hypothetical protein ABSA75_04300 [Candidatus Bathyarchaeia archaeon]|jgi:hypothetical protein